MFTKFCKRGSPSHDNVYIYLYVSDQSVFIGSKDKGIEYTNQAKQTNDGPTPFTSYWTNVEGAPTV